MKLLFSASRSGASEQRVELLTSCSSSLSLLESSFGTASLFLSLSSILDSFYCKIETAGIRKQLYTLKNKVYWVLFLTKISKSTEVLHCDAPETYQVGSHDYFAIQSVVPENEERQAIVYLSPNDEAPCTKKMLIVVSIT